MTTPICRNWAFVPSTKANDSSRHLYTHFFQAPIAQATKMAEKEFKSLYPDAIPMITPSMSNLDDSPST